MCIRKCCGLFIVLCSVLSTSDGSKPITAGDKECQVLETNRTCPTWTHYDPIRRQCVCLPIPRNLDNMVACVEEGNNTEVFLILGRCITRSKNQMHVEVAICPYYVLEKKILDTFLN